MNNRRTLISLLAVAAGTLMLMAPAWPERDRMADIAAGRAQQVLDDLESASPSHSVGDDERIRGHALLALGRENEALRAWARAAGTGQVVEEIAGRLALGRLGADDDADAVAVLRRSHDPFVIDGLVRLTQSRSWAVRHRALMLVTAHGALDRVDLEAFAARDLLEGDSCGRRVSGLDMLRKHGRTEAALEALARARRADDGCLSRLVGPVENTLRVLVTPR